MYEKNDLFKNLKSFIDAAFGNTKKCFLYNHTYSSAVTRYGNRRRNITACEPQ